MSLLQNDNKIILIYICYPVLTEGISLGTYGRWCWLDLPRGRAWGTLHLICSVYQPDLSWDWVGMIHWDWVMHWGRVGITLILAIDFTSNLIPSQPPSLISAGAQHGPGAGAGGGAGDGALSWITRADRSMITFMDHQS